MNRRQLFEARTVAHVAGQVLAAAEEPRAVDLPDDVLEVRTRDDRGPRAATEEGVEQADDLPRVGGT